jgi:hypothetical protein
MLPASIGTSRDAGIRLTSPALPHKTPSKLDVSKEKMAVRQEYAPQDAASIQMPSGTMENVEILEHDKLDVSDLPPKFVPHPELEFRYQVSC